MNTSLKTFISVSVTIIILTTLLMAITLQSLQDRNDQHQRVIETEHQIQPY